MKIYPKLMPRMIFWIIAPLFLWAMGWMVYDILFVPAEGVGTRWYERDYLKGSLIISAIALLVALGLSVSILRVMWVFVRHSGLRRSPDLIIEQEGLWMDICKTKDLIPWSEVERVEFAPKTDEERYRVSMFITRSSAKNRFATFHIKGQERYIDRIIGKKIPPDFAMNYYDMDEEDIAKELEKYVLVERR